MADLHTSKVKKVLVVDDSAFMRKLITDFLNDHPNMKVIGTARNGKDAIEKVKKLQPDVVTLDIEMPIMNGLDALKEIMKTTPVPVVILSSTTKEGTKNTMLAMEYGAVDLIAKPGGAISLNLHDVKDEIIEKVLAAADVPLFKLTKLDRTDDSTRHATESRKQLQTNRPPIQLTTTEQRGLPAKKDTNEIFTKMHKTIVLIGTSTGGPRALQEVLTRLPANFQAPILIVQHMPPSFTKSLADRLDGLCAIRVKEAADGEALTNGTAYIAPGGKHLNVRKLGTSYFAHVGDEEPPRLGHRPSVDVLFESAAKLTDINCVAVVMTGMGSDGKNGMERLKEYGRTVAIAESQETSVVYGMPKAIVDAGLADEVVDVHDISNAILERVHF